MVATRGGGAEQRNFFVRRRHQEAVIGPEEIYWRLSLMTRARETATIDRVDEISDLLTRHHPTLTSQPYTIDSETSTMPASCRFELFPISLDKALEFYIGILDFKLMKRTPPDYAYVVRDGIRIGIVGRSASYFRDFGQDPQERVRYRLPPTGVEIVIEVDDLDAEHDKIVQRGWKIAEQIELKDWGLRDFRIHDPDGHYLRFTEHSNTAGTGTLV